MAKAGEVSHGFTFSFTPDNATHGNFDASVRLIDWGYGGVTAGKIDMTDQQSKGGYEENMPGTSTNAEVTLSLKMFRDSTCPQLKSFGTLKIFWPTATDEDTPSTLPILSVYGWWSKIKEISGTHGERITHSIAFQPTGAVAMNESPTP